MENDLVYDEGDNELFEHEHNIMLMVLLEDDMTDNQYFSIYGSADDDIGGIY